MRTVGIGRQDFEKIRVHHNFYVDKTDLIRQWWEADDDVTLVTSARSVKDTEHEYAAAIFLFGLQG